MNKPVWRVYNGNGRPSDLGRAYLCLGEIISFRSNEEVPIGSLWFKHMNFPPLVAAYETTRIKKAKCEQAE